MSEPEQRTDDPGPGEAQPRGADGTPPAAPDSYEAAVERLEEIIRALDSGRSGLRATLELVREGKTLVEYCRAELDAVSGELEELDLDQLVSQLERTSDESGA